MKRERIIQYMDLLNEKYIAEASPENAENIKKKRKASYLRYAALAASFALVIGAMAVMPYLRQDDLIQPYDSSKPDESIQHSVESSDIVTLPPESQSDLSDDSEHQINQDDSDDMNNSSGESNPVGGGDYSFSRKYQDETYDIACLGRLYRDETPLLPEGALSEWTDEVFLKKSPEEQDALPTLYMAVHDLNISKDDLTALNEERKERGSSSVLSDALIDALYLPEEDMKKALVHPCALYHNGEIYTWDELEAMTVDGTTEDVITKEELNQYVDRVVDYCIRSGYISENMVEKYFTEYELYNTNS